MPWLQPDELVHFSASVDENETAAARLCDGSSLTTLPPSLCSSLRYGRRSGATSTRWRWRHTSTASMPRSPMSLRCWSGIGGPCERACSWWANTLP
eukprot:3455441-Rhodomonas_salina.7